MAEYSRNSAPAYGDQAGWQKLAQECAQGAVYDSKERQPHSKCLPGTRESLLQSLRTLVEEQSRKIIWVAGESGSGKSTVAHTFADELRGQDRLAGTFFFSRKHTKRSTFDHVLLTLAYQLGLHHPRAKEVIMKAIWDDPALLSPEKSHHDQLEKLIIQPLRRLAQIWENKPGVSLIWDALDEGTANGTHHIRPFITLLSALVRDSTLPIHNIIITSRTWPQIDAVMRDEAFSDIMRIVSLEDHDSREDIDRFFRNAFAQMYNAHGLSPFCPRPWPKEDDLLMLSQRANGRFIFAATIIRFVDQPTTEIGPQERLSLACSMLRGDDQRNWGNIDHLYTSIIDQIDDSFREAGLKYLHLIVNLAEPLPLPDICQLLGVAVLSPLLPFSPLISIPPPDSSDPVQIFHTSLRDFLQSYDSPEAGQAAVSTSHRRLAVRCFQTMETSLKRDICGLGDSSLLHEEIPDFDQKRDTSIPRTLRYACRHWLYHLELTHADMEIQGRLLDFLENRLLFAIETYSILGELGVAVGFFRVARKLVMGWPDSRTWPKDDALALLNDSWRLVMDFFDPISVSALHVYESALPCAPAKSQIRLAYSHVLAEATCFTFEDGLDDEWSCVTRVIDMKAHRVDYVALSPDTSQVAMLHQDPKGGMIMLWDTATGVLITSYLLEGLCSWSDHYSLGHGGSFVAVRNLRECYLWQPTSQMVSRIVPQTMKQADELVGTLSFSHSGDKIAFLSAPRTLSIANFTVHIHDTISLRQISCWSVPLHSVQLHAAGLDFSHQDDCLLVQVWIKQHSDVGHILVYSTDGQLLWRHEFEHGYYRYAIFSFDDDIIIDAHLTPDNGFTISYIRSLVRGSVAPPQIALDSQPNFRSYSNLSFLSNGLMRRQNSVHPNRKLPPVTGAQARVYKVLDPAEMPSHDRPEFITEPVSQKQVAVRHGDKISAIVKNAQGGLTRTRWRSQNVECFGVFHNAGSVQIIDLSQAATASIDSSRPHAFVSETNETMKINGYRPVLISGRNDVIAYRLKTAQMIDLILVGRGTESTEDAFRTSIVSNDGWSLPADAPAYVNYAFSPKSTYFSVLTTRKEEGRIQVWNSRSGALIGGAPVTIPEAASGWKTTFTEDETLMVVSCWTHYSPDSNFSHVYSLESAARNAIKLIDSIPSPSSIRARTCSVVSATSDTIDYFCTDGSHICHMQWRRALSEHFLVSSSQHIGHIFGRFISTGFDNLQLTVMHSTRLKRVYCRIGEQVGEDNMECTLNFRERSAPGRIGIYKVDKDKGPKAFYDHCTWSDLCMDVDGWFRQRSRRICWLPERYRPSDLGKRGLELIVEGNRVTILNLRNDKRITIQLLNTNINYFD